MLDPPAKGGRVCAWLRSRRASKSAALLTRPARRALQNLSGRRASRQIDAKTPAAGVEQRAWLKQFSSL